MVTGQLKSTLIETLRREAGICSIATVSKHAPVLAYEKANRLPLAHPHPLDTPLQDQAGDLLHDECINRHVVKTDGLN